jgi:hypothetical protein
MTMGGSVLSLRRPIRLAVVGVAVAAALASPLIAAGATTSWALATSPNPGANSNRLNGVACPDATHCWAVGVTNNTGTNQTLIERWNGTAWSVDTSGNENGLTTLQENELNGVTCTSITNCWAVGEFFQNIVGNVSSWEPLWEHWNGSTWTASTFVVGVANNYWLEGVSCVDAGHCWAVGYRNPVTGGNPTVWIEQWNGSFWSNDPSTTAGILRGVSCVDATHCWAVGGVSGTPAKNVIERWNGTAWSAVTAPNRGSNFNGLQGVSCVSSTDCWAVGRFNDGTFEQNLFLFWNGTTWTIPVASTAASNNNAPTENTNFLDGVTCLSTTYCWAVGADRVSGSASRTLIDRWDGTSWTLVPGTPNRGTTFQPNNLYGVACADTGHCAAVGEYSPPDPTLILQFIAAAVPTPAPVPVPPTGGAGAQGGMDAGAPLAGLLVAGGVLTLLGGGALYVGVRRTRRV